MMDSQHLLQVFSSLALVVALILLTGYLLRQYQQWRETNGASPMQTGSQAKRQQPDLSIVRVMPIDFRRKLVMIRRDDVYHLLLCSDGCDTVIETGIQLADAANSNAPHQSQSSQS